MMIKDVRSEFPLAKGRKWPVRNEREIDTIVIHHAAAPERKDGDTLKQLKQFAELHQRPGHLSKRGGATIAYHYAIDGKGEVWKCNRLSHATWHAQGANANGVGIILLGNFELTTPSATALESLRELVSILRRDLPNCWRVLGHREVKGSSTACPGKHFTKEMLDALRL